MRSTLVLVFALNLLAIGCSAKPELLPDPADVTVTVTLPDGKPASGLRLNLFPTASGQMQGGGTTDANGKFKAKLLPGTYTYAFDNPSPAVPKKYHSNSAEITAELPAGATEMALKLSK